MGTNGTARKLTPTGSREMDSPALPAGRDRLSGIPSLSPPQEAAMAALLTGANLTEAATAAGVVRQTVAVWLREDSAFVAEYQSRRAELWTGVRNRLEVRLVKAADTVAALLDHDDWRARLAAARVLLDLAARQFPSPPSPATPEEAADDLRHRAKQRENDAKVRELLASI